MNVVVGMPVKDRAWILPEWFDAIYSQGVEVDIVALVSPSEDGTEGLLRAEQITVVEDDRRVRSTLEIDGHLWGSLDTYAYMAGLRNRLTDIAIEREADYFFSLDSDIILPEGSLKYLLDFAAEHPGVTSPAVNMTTGDTAWNTMSWTDRDFPGMAYRPSKRPTAGQVDIVMAAMLLDRTGMECIWQAHGQGEDVGYCLDAYTRQVPLWWVPEVQCEHRMRRMA
jgi:hypothetical protein